MEHENYPIQWTEDQWNLVQQTVRDEARNRRVAASFLPVHGPLAPETDSVPLQELDETQFIDRPARGEPPNRLSVDDRRTRPLTTISMNVYLRTPQAAQPDLSSALSMFRRTANIMARLEDTLIFQGQRTANPFLPVRQAFWLPSTFTVSGGEVFRGLLTMARARGAGFQPIPGSMRIYPPNELVGHIAFMIGEIEQRGFLPPFALVLGNDLFAKAHEPTNSLVMPADRIKPMLNGPLLRSSVLDRNQGILMSLSGDPVDLALASDISVKFLQVTMEPRYVFRVSQRFTLRIKQPGALMAMGPQ